MKAQYWNTIEFIKKVMWDLDNAPYPLTQEFSVASTSIIQNM